MTLPALKINGLAILNFIFESKIAIFARPF
jgi:hypothetical protein